MAVDGARSEREPVANDLAVNDVRGLLADHQSTGHALSLELNLQHELVPGHGSSLPIAIPRKPGVLAGTERKGEARCALRERLIDSRRDRMSGRADDRYRCDCQRALHLVTSLFRNLAGATVTPQASPAGPH